MMHTRATNDVVTASPHSTHSDRPVSKYRKPSVTLQTLQYGPVVNGLQGTPFMLAHADVLGEDASGQRLRSELLLFVRQYPGLKGSRASVYPDFMHADPIGHGLQDTLSAAAALLLRLS